MAGRRLGEVLIEQGLITEEQIHECINLQRQQGGNLASILIEKEYISEEDLVVALSEQLAIPHIRVAHFNIPEKVLEEVPENLARQYLMFPVSLTGDFLTLAMVNPLDLMALDDLGLVTRYEIKPVVAMQSELIESIENHYGTGAKGVEPSMEPEDWDGPLEEDPVVDDAPPDLDTLPERKRLSDLLIEKEYLSEEDLAVALGKHLDMPLIRISHYAVRREILELIPETLALKLLVMPVSIKDEKLVLAMADPRNVTAIDDMSFLTGHEIMPVVAQESELIRSIEKCYNPSKPTAWEELL